MLINSNSEAKEIQRIIREIDGSVLNLECTNVLNQKNEQ